LKDKQLLIISACRNEGKYLEKCIPSILEQTLQPTLWVIVDDGSTDETPTLLAKYEKEHPFIKVITKTDRGKRKVGPGVVETFYEGLNSVDWEAYSFLCKLDLDLVLPPNYFETLIDRMDENPRIGTCSGKAYYADSKGKLVSEKCGDEMSQGMTKLFRTVCFKEIGGFVREVMWDGIDCHRCRMLGWIALSWDDPELRFIHLRPMGSSQSGILTGRARHGFGQYFMGTSPFYMLVSAIYRMTRPPYLVGGVAMLYGYLKAFFQNVMRYDDLEFRKFLRRYQWNCLFFGKKKATRRLDAEMEGVWKRTHHAFN